MTRYNKPPLNYSEQVKLLESRGLIIGNKKKAERLLANISYYRLSAYMLPYKVCMNGFIQDLFKDGTTLDMVYDLYKFDRKLRLLLFDAIERIEVAIRTQIVTQLSLKYGSHWQMIVAFSESLANVEDEMGLHSLMMCSVIFKNTFKIDYAMIVPKHSYSIIEKLILNLLIHLHG